MRRLVFLLILAAGAAMFSISCARQESVPKSGARLYYVDANINMLLPFEEDVIDASKEYRAKAVLDMLIKGHDNNDKIRRLIPREKGCITCSVNDTTAYVDIDSKIRESMPDSRDMERLFIYQIVDTLTSIKGINYVRFTVDGEVHKDFMGYYDMRETYSYSYPE